MMVVAARRGPAKVEAKLGETVEVEQVDFKNGFSWTEEVLGVVVHAQQLGTLMRELRSVVLRRRVQKNVVVVDEHPGCKAILFDPAVAPDEEALLKALEGRSVRDALLAAKVGTKRIQVVSGYEDLSTEEVLRQLLPSSVQEIPSSFELVGHVAHVNLRDECLPYRKLVGKVLMDKNPALRTVVNKVGTINNVFRTFPMEVIAGENKLTVEVREYGAIFRFDFSKVYWNSRLQEEHQRVVSQFLPDQVVVDGFCGVGPFVIPAALKGCRVVASDLNPESHAALVANVRLNKVEGRVSASNLDAREFMRKVFRDDRLVAHHVVMNLPATALEFLDALVGVFPRDLYGEEPSAAGGADESPGPAKRAKTDGPPGCAQQGQPLNALPLVHCYCFSGAEDFKADIIARAEAAMAGAIDPAGVVVRRVRDVAPKKKMYCVEFRVPAAIGLQPAPAAAT